MKTNIVRKYKGHNIYQANLQTENWTWKCFHW